MNRSNWIHAGIAVAMQIAGMIITGSVFIGAAFASGWFISREYTQREYRLHVYGQKYDLKWWQGFTGWSRDNVLDAFAPVAAVSVICAFSLIFSL